MANCIANGDVTCSQLRVHHEHHRKRPPSAGIALFDNDGIDQPQLCCVAVKVIRHGRRTVKPTRILTKPMTVT